jgi:hypothetical protein
VREHEAAVTRARREGVAAGLRGVRVLLEPGAWPPASGFEAAPLRWDAPEGSLLAYAVAAEAGASRSFPESPWPGRLRRPLSPRCRGRSCSVPPPPDDLEKIQEAAPPVPRQRDGRVAPLISASAPLPSSCEAAAMHRRPGEGGKQDWPRRDLARRPAIVASSGLERLRSRTRRPPEQLARSWRSGGVRAAATAFEQSVAAGRPRTSLPVRPTSPPAARRIRSKVQGPKSCHPERSEGSAPVSYSGNSPPS